MSEKHDPGSLIRGPSTRSVHAGRSGPAVGGTALSIQPSAVYAFNSLDEGVDTFTGKRSGYVYGRYGHPTGEAVEARLAALEGAESALLFSSGMAAITLTALAYCGEGGHLIASAELYGGTTELLTDVLPACGIAVDRVPLDELGSLAGRVRENTRMVLVESPTNPLLRCVDFERLMAGLPAPRPLMVLDSTFATPLGQSGLTAGFDLVVHSATKYLGGHDDLVAGMVAGPPEVLKPIRERRRVVGANCDPQTAWLVDRGMKTLALRWERQCANALALARRLEEHPAVARVHYPGLASHPHHEIARRQMRTFGAVLAFDVAGGMDAARRAFDRFGLIARAPSLGGVESMTLHPATSSHRGLSLEERRAVGITEGLLRLSAGIEDEEDLWADLEQALR
jgi:cystathionine beta-lyase/cystathionine gamma-synthase